MTKTGNALMVGATVLMLVVAAILTSKSMARVTRTPPAPPPQVAPSPAPAAPIPVPVAPPALVEKIEAPKTPVTPEPSAQVKPPEVQQPAPPTPRDPLLDSAKFGPNAKNWIATRLLYIATLPDSTPCTIRLTNIEGAVRVRSTWNAPGGPPKDPPFLIEMENFWRAKAQRVVVYHSFQLVKKLEGLREQVLLALPETARKSLAELYPNTELQYGVQWKAWTKVAGGKFEKNDWILLLPKPGVRLFWMMGQKLDGLAGEQLDSETLKKLGVLEDLEVKAWEGTALDVIADLANLTGATESMGVEQFGKDLAPSVKQAFGMRRLAERQVAQTRLRIFLGAMTHPQPEADADNRKEAALLPSEERAIYTQDKLREAEAELRKNGVVRLPADKIESPNTLPAFRNTALWLNDIERQLNGTVPEKPIVPEKF